MNKNRLCALGAIISAVVLLIAIGQLDNFCSAILWGTGEQAKVVEVWSIPWVGHAYTTVGQWYNLMWLIIGISFICFGVSLWYWE